MNFVLRPVSMDRRVADRRGFLAGLLIAPVVVTVLAGCDDERIDDAKRANFFAITGDHVIPATETAGASAAGVPQWLSMLWALGLLPIAVDALIAECDRRAGGSFVQASAAERYRILEEIDGEAFAPSAAATESSWQSAWRKLKLEILNGYYTSEVGASGELAYVPVPGRYDANIPITADARAVSNDWRALLVS